MTDNTKELLNLIKANPDLPIVPLVYYEVVGDYDGYWMGKWGSAKVDEYCTKEDLYGDGRIEFRSTCDMDIVAVFERYFDYEECGITDDMSDEDADKIIKEKVDSLPWEKAIIVYICTL